MDAARANAFNILLDVGAGGFADELLRLRPLESRDAALAQELVMGVLRHRVQLDYLIDYFSGRQAKTDPVVRVALWMGIYQMRYLDRIPTHAAVSTSVDLVKRSKRASAAGFVNAVLRKVHRDPVPWPSDAIRLSMPEWMLTRWESHFGKEDAHRAAAYFLQRPTAAHRGERMMDEGAQSIVPHLGLEPQHRFLDLCAAPGNKTLHAAEYGVSPVACDRSWPRLHDIPVSRRVQLDAAAPLPFAPVFDRILVDAPCSGTGTLGRNPEIKWRVTQEDLSRQALRQAQILGRALEVLKPGGRLVYSTCSLEAEENEDVVAQVASRVRETGYRLPGRDPGDGFFHAVLA